MNKKIEEQFSEMVANLLQTEICKDFDPAMLHGFMGCASEAGEILNRYKKFMFYHGEPYTRTETLIELSDLLHFMQQILNKLNSSIEELMHINMAKLGSRYPEGYTHDKAITGNRDKEAERAAVEKVIATFAALRENKDK